MGGLAERKETGVTTYERKFTKEQLELIRKTIVPMEASTQEVNWFLGQAKRTGLDPLGRQIYLILFGDGRGGKKPVIHIGIDGHLTIANRTGDYAGMDDPIYGPMLTGKYETTEYQYPEWCTVTIYKMVHGQKVSFTDTCYWDEYYPGPRGFKWRQGGGRNQLSKCTKCKVLRQGFPNEFAGTYGTAEIEKMQSEEARQGADFIRKFMASIPEEIDVLLTSEEVSHKDRIKLYKELNFDLNEIGKAFAFLQQIESEDLLARLKEKGFMNSVLIAKEAGYDLEKLTAALEPFKEEAKE